MTNNILKMGKRLKGNFSAKVGVAIVVAVMCTMLFAPYLAPHDPEKMSLGDRLRPPYGFQESKGRPICCIAGRVCVKNL